jgi:asparagine synthase (glutamine-hydrolysing)
MCGIAGIYQQNEKRAPIEIAETLGTFMDHRGPDDFSCFGFEKIAMSHSRLSHLDLSSAANQPFRNQHYSLVYNGEIYNFEELRAQLKKEFGVNFKTTSDTEVLFHALIKLGVDECLKQIRGMYAFAFYDKEKHELTLVRDRLGIKPLFYLQRDERVFWSSEVKAIANVLAIKPDPLRTLFSIGGHVETSTEYTLFGDIRPVKPGTYLRFVRGKTIPAEVTYYTPLGDFDPYLFRKRQGQSSNVVRAEFERLLTASVRRMSISDAQIGAFVSGGVDSALISATAKQFFPNLKLFTSNVVGELSEVEDARALARHLGLELFDHKFTPDMMLRNWAETTYFNECPIVVHTNAIPFASVARMASNLGIKAALTGEGSDELFLGYPRLLAQRYEKLAYLPYRVLDSLYSFVPGLSDYLFPKSKPSTADFLNRLARRFESARRDLTLDTHLDGVSLESRRHEERMTIKMLGDHLVGLLNRNDRMGMMSSVEARFPFLDEELVKFAINLPAKFKIRRSLRLHNIKHPFLIDKSIVRQTARKYLPVKLAYKEKMGFPMKGHKFVRLKEGFFNNGWVADCLSMKKSHQDFMIETQDPYAVAKLASVEVFGRLYAAGESIETVRDHVMRYAAIEN